MHLDLQQGNVAMRLSFHTAVPRTGMYMIDVKVASRRLD